jgi:hypothetical protein
LATITKSIVGNTPHGKLIRYLWLSNFYGGEEKTELKRPSKRGKYRRRKNKLVARGSTEKPKGSPAKTAISNGDACPWKQKNCGRARLKESKLMEIR